MKRPPPDSALKASTLPDPVHVDMASALDNMDRDTGLYEQVVRIFLGDAPACLEQLRVAWAAADTATTVRAAHTLKGMAATIGAEPLHQHLRALEAALATQDAHSFQQMLPSVESELAQVLSTLRDFLAA
jgi:two-component system sensor histidine kinase/response regulator